MKKISSSDVGIIAASIGMIASVVVIIINALQKESIGVGIGLLLFCILSLSTNVRNKRNEIHKKHIQDRQRPLKQPYDGTVQGNQALYGISS